MFEKFSNSKKTRDDKEEKESEKKNSISTRRKRKKIKKKENDYMTSMKNNDLDSNDNEKTSSINFSLSTSSNVFDNEKKNWSLASTNLRSSSINFIAFFSRFLKAKIDRKLFKSEVLKIFEFFFFSLIAFFSLARYTHLLIVTQYWVLSSTIINYTFYFNLLISFYIISRFVCEFYLQSLLFFTFLYHL